MISYDRMMRIKFNTSELVSILTQEEFDYHRAGKWMDDHVIFTLQAVFLYLVSIFSIQHMMRSRDPFKLQMPVAVWNFSIALLSGVCATIMAPEFVNSVFCKGFDASLCSTREEVYSGMNGWAVFILLFSRLPEFIDTLFIVLKKQPLLFIHYYHHAFTLWFAWSTYTMFAPSFRHAIFINACIHTVMYSYYFFTTLKIRPPPFVAKCITIAQIVQFIYIFYALIHHTILTVILNVPCQTNTTGLVLSWYMDLSYLYLFIDFYTNKYKGSKKASQTSKKID
ncbi:hypothetical protein PENTCL1PPCAC_15547 [Pristionchus entomophagus]|uniref:Elongation of very long chain fatty acids protein n=1 Tax=Pristionchus entomophagus TaxID=358040 RepID=A0AAV5TCT8_9BILA|nr:hypothetical protein PENTCL1PPCAC_15547 [Pristionchus entomophagus]